MDKPYLIAVRLVCTLWLSFSLSVEADESNHETVTFYSDVRKDVRISELVDNKKFSEARPEGFFQNAGSRNSVICQEMLDSLNESGSYTGGNIANWLSEGRGKITFSALPDSKDLPALFGVKKEMEYLSVDVDGDRESEHIYKRTGIIGGQIYQQIMIVDYPLHLRPEMLKPYVEGCKRWRSSDSDCDGGADLISFLMNEPPSRRLADEWSFTRSNPISYFTGNGGSAALIFPDGRNTAKRNLGTSSGIYWEFYKIDFGVVVVSVPVSVFAPPELLVFTPERRGPGQLQCVIAPLSW